MTDFEKTFRSRWQRWAAQKCRHDRSAWTELLQSNWLAWVEQVYGESNIVYKPVGFDADRVMVLMLYKKAIETATLDQLRRLDNLWCEMEMEKKYH